MSERPPSRPNLAVGALAPALEQLRARPVLHVTEVVAALLAVCRAEEALVSREKTLAAHFYPSADLEARLYKTCPDRGRERWRARELRELADTLVASVPPLPGALAAYVAARWLERQFRAHLIHFFRGVDRQVEAGEPWPILDSPAPCYPRPTGNPASRGRAGDRGEWLTLTPTATAGLRIRMRWLGPRLPVIRAGTRIAIAALSRDPLTDFTFDRLTPDGAPRFYGVRPVDDDFRTRVDAVLAHARAVGATITILPELTLTEADHAAVLADPALAAMPLVVLGSRHVDRPSPDEPGRNVATLVAYGKVIGEHAKMSDFFVRDGGVHRYEHIVPGDTIEVLVSERLSLAMVVCKDLLRGDWQHLLTQLAPRLLLVPAMSVECGDFLAFAERLARDPQSHTVVANAGPIQAIVGRPAREDPVIVADRPIGRCIVYEVGAGFVNDHPLGSNQS
ncbi:MAG: hypothetical protein R3B06_24230 [Kofleriaceae bacterium]